MSQDVFTIDYVEFMERRPYGKVDKRDAERLELILQYPCFKEENNFFPPYVVSTGNGNGNGYGSAGFGLGGNGGRHGRFGIRNGFKNKVIHRRRPTTIEKDLHHKDVLAILNKITSSNYESLCRKLTFMCTNDNIEKIALYILEKCCKQFAYAHTFMSVLMHINGIFPIHVGNVIKSFCDGWFSGVANELEHIDRISKETGYNEFCDFVARKALFVNSHQVMVMLLTRKLCVHDGQHVADLIHHMMKDGQSSVIVDILVSCLGNLLTAHNSILLEQEVKDIKYCLESVKCGCENKIRFKILDILQILG